MFSKLVKDVLYASSCACSVLSMAAAGHFYLIFSLLHINPLDRFFSKSAFCVLLVFCSMPVVVLS